MKLYYSKGTCSLAPRIIINELGLKCEFESVDLTTKKTETGEDYYKINAKGYVPALMLSNGELLTENAAILQYLAEQNNAVNLLPPSSDFNHYKVLQWLNYLATEIHKSFGGLFNKNISQTDKENVFLPLLKNKFNFLNSHLEKNTYLTGENFTLPDAYLFVTLGWTTYFKMDLNEWPHIMRYLKNLRTRKAIQISLAQEGLQPATSS